MEVTRQLSGAAWVAGMRPCLASEAETIESSGYGLDDLLSDRLSGNADRAARGANAVESARRSAPTTKTVADRAAAARGHGREEA